MDLIFIENLWIFILCDFHLGWSLEDVGKGTRFSSTVLQIFPFSNHSPFERSEKLVSDIFQLLPPSVPCSQKVVLTIPGLQELCVLGIIDSSLYLTHSNVHLLYDKEISWTAGISVLGIRYCFFFFFFFLSVPKLYSTPQIPRILLDVRDSLF